MWRARSTRRKPPYRVSGGRINVLRVGLPCNSIEKKKTQMILARALAYQPSPPLPPYHKSIRSAFTVHRFRYISRYQPRCRASSSGAMNLFSASNKTEIYLPPFTSKLRTKVARRTVFLSNRFQRFRKINYFLKFEKLFGREREREREREIFLSTIIL